MRYSTLLLTSCLIAFTPKCFAEEAAETKIEEPVAEKAPEDLAHVLKYEDIYNYGISNDTELPVHITAAGAPTDIFSLLAITDAMKADRKRICVGMKKLGENTVSILNRIPEKHQDEFCASVTANNLVASHFFDLVSHTDILVRDSEVADADDYRESQNTINNALLVMCSGKMSSDASSVYRKYTWGVAVAVISVIAAFV